MRKLLAVLSALSLMVAIVGVPAAGAGHDVNGTVCLVADQGGFDDGGFNAGALEGLERADKKLHVATEAAAAEAEADLPGIIESFVDSGECDLIIGVGFIVGAAMEPYVAANPDQRFAVVDFAYGIPYGNVAELLFQVDQAAFLAGYIAAGISDTGKVGVYGGAAIPPVTMFMDGYALGVEYYNQENGAAVEVLGWDPDTRSGLLLNFEFNNPALGRAVTLDLFDQGADTVFAVAGPTGLGSLEAAAERKAEGDVVRVIEPDFDWFDRYGDPARVLLTSVLKNTDVAVFNTIDAFVNGTWQAGAVWEDLASGGVGLAPFHKTNNQVPGFLKNDLKLIGAAIIDGTIPTLPDLGGTACLVTDPAGIDDASFNESAWDGALAAAAAFPGVTVSFLESQSFADIRPNLDTFVEQGCDVIVTVGFLATEDTAAAAKENPTQDFAIVDMVVGDFAPWCVADPLPDGTCGGDYVTNVRGSTFATDESSFLAGYVSAGMTETGVVGTFGGAPFSSVTIFMDGFVWGVEHYNTVKGISVQALGWNPDTQDGLFTNSFEDLQLGRDFAEDLVDQGADIVFPVAGPLGLGSADYCQDTASCLTIGVDVDWFFHVPEFADVVLTSVVKGIDVFVFDTIENVITTGSPGDQYVGTLANDGTDIAPYHDFEEVVPQTLKDEVDQLRQDIIDGIVVPGS